MLVAIVTIVLGACVLYLAVKFAVQHGIDDSVLGRRAQEEQSAPPVLLDENQRGGAPEQNTILEQTERNSKENTKK